MGTLADAVRITDAEILSEAMGDHDYDEGNPAYQNMPEGDGADDLLEGTEGFDGEPLSDAEQFATANGDVPEGYLGDRPLQFMHEQELMRELAWRRAGHDDNNQVSKELMALDQSQRDEQARFQLSNYLQQNGMNGDAAYQTATWVQGIEQQRLAAAAQVQAAGTNRLEASFRAAERDYGDQFVERAVWLNDLSSRAHRGDQVAASTIRSIINQHDAGTALMEWEDSNPYQPPPFMAGRRSAATPSRQGNLTYDDLEASSSAGSDEDIFNSVVGDSRDDPYWQTYGG